MKYGIKILAVSIALLMCSTNVLADETKTVTYKATIENENISIIETDLKNCVDNSDLNVKVVKQIGEQSTTVYEGLLGGYDDGEWSDIDFSDINFLVLFNCESMENEAIYIIPNDLNTEKTLENTPIKQRTMNTLLPSTNIIQYDLSYSITNDSTDTILNVECTMTNNGSETKTPVLLIALYDDGKLLNFMSNDIPVNGNSNSGLQNFSFTLPSPNKDSYSIKLMAWDSIGSIRPLGSVKSIKDLETFSREKCIFITASENTSFNVFMNSIYSKGDNEVMTHTISYDTQRITPIDLCGFTYTKELAPFNIERVGVEVTEYDAQTGKIVYQFSKPTGRNTGINNIVKFKALTGLTNAQITYTIQ